MIAARVNARVTPITTTAYLHLLHEHALEDYRASEAESEVDTMEAVRGMVALAQPDTNDDDAFTLAAAVANLDTLMTNTTFDALAARERQALRRAREIITATIGWLAETHGVELSASVTHLSGVGGPLLGLTMESISSPKP